jgi:hypothetical protein
MLHVVRTTCPYGGYKVRQWGCGGAPRNVQETSNERVRPPNAAFERLAVVRPCYLVPLGDLGVGPLTNQVLLTIVN